MSTKVLLWIIIPLILIGTGVTLYVWNQPAQTGATGSNNGGNNDPYNLNTDPSGNPVEHIPRS